MEFASLYAEGEGPPDPNGPLLGMEIIGTPGEEFCLDVRVNDIRGGIVMEDVTTRGVYTPGECYTLAEFVPEPPEKCFYVDLVDGCGYVITQDDVNEWILAGEPNSWCYPCHCRGDIDADCLINSNDILGTAEANGWQYAWNNRTTDYVPESDTDYSGGIDSSDILGTGSPLGDGWQTGWALKCADVCDFNFPDFPCP
jgi:hypothetical protein